MIALCISHGCFFFFKQKTAYEMRISDWSSDVCSSDLLLGGARAAVEGHEHEAAGIERGHEGRQHAHREGEVAVRRVIGEGRFHHDVLGIEAGDRKSVV